MKARIECMKNKKILTLILAVLTVASLAVTLCGCGGSTAEIITTTTAAETTKSESSDDSDEATTTSKEDWYAPDEFTSLTVKTIETQNAADAEDSRQDNSGEFKIESDVSDGYTVNGTTYTITQAGEYTLSGTLEGNITIDASEDAEVEIILDGCTITSSSVAPIYASSADKVKITAKEGSFNEIIDSREAKSTDDEVKDASNAGAAIYAACDLHIKGNGALVVSGTYNNGIQSKDDLEIKNLTLKVTAANVAIKGNDSVLIESGNIIAIAEGGDGIKTDNSDVSTKGNQKGTITIQGGIVDVYAACDGVSASYDVVVEGDGYLNINTDTYSDYSSGKSSTGGSDFYLIVPSSDYSESYDYYAYYYDSDSDDGTWVKSEYSTMVNNGRTQYYGLKLSQPSGASNVAYYIFNSGAEPSTSDYVATSDGCTVNTSMNAYLMSTISGSSIDGDFVSLSTSSSGNGSGQAYSTKGIKADNYVYINGATTVINSTDDAIHANAGTELENGETGTGSVQINGGYILINSGDDGIHADVDLTINAGYINIETSYEGLEANTINVNDGRIWIYASDDGMNASTAYIKSGATITVNGGYVDVTTPTGDTDAIDSNGNYIQNGGFVLVKGGSSQGSMAGSVDVDGTITVNAGGVVAVGGICETPDGDANAYVASGQSFAAGEYVIKDGSGNEVLSFTLTSTYSSGWFACELFESGTSYTLTQDGSELISWTQEDGTMGATNGGMGGMNGGGMGGHGGFGGR